jgi:photosystem II stability/assembly factor-like uncharacterized protein
VVVVACTPDDVLVGSRGAADGGSRTATGSDGGAAPDGATSTSDATRAAAGGADGATGGTGGGGGGGAIPGCVGAETGVWTNVSPAGVSLDPIVNGGANYGFHHVTVHPTTPSTVYVGADRQGLWRSEDCGASWEKIDTGVGAGEIDAGAPWAFAIDPVEPDTMYIASGEGANGLFKSVDGGIDWVQLFTEGNVTEPVNPFGSAPNIYSIAIDPFDHQHIICGFRERWLVPDGSGDAVDAGVVESTDGGASWQLKDGRDGMGEGHTVFFLDDGDSWLVVPEHGTIHRSVDAGQSWEQVSTYESRAGGSQMHRSNDGTYYLSASFAILRSTDGGATWTNVVEGRGLSTQGLVGDGQRIFASDGASFQGQLYGAPYPPFWAAPESPGDEGWSVLSDQLYDNGANRMAVDRTHGFIYASSWGVGVLRMFTD